MGGSNPNIQATHLNKDQEALFQQWKAKNRPNDSGVDYDLRGAWLSQVKPDGRNHLDDEFKFQNHPTFSTGSKYQDANHIGGVWGKTVDGMRDTYEPAAWMEKDASRMEDLRHYMKAEEPNAILIRRAEPIN